MNDLLFVLLEQDNHLLDYLIVLIVLMMTYNIYVYKNMFLKLGNKIYP